MLDLGKSPALVWAWLKTAAASLERIQQLSQFRSWDVKISGRNEMSAIPEKRTLRSLSESDRHHVMHPFSNLAEQASGDPRILSHAEGVRIFTADGREYIDAGSGLWCVNIGYGRQEIADTMAEQSRRLSYGLCFGGFSN